MFFVGGKTSYQNISWDLFPYPAAALAGFGPSTGSFLMSFDVLFSSVLIIGID